MIVAIPARDEATHIIDCFRALASQRTRAGDDRRVGDSEVILLVNNSTDATAAIARDWSGSLPFRLSVLEKTLSKRQAHAGGARRAVMNVAARRAKSSEAIICTTDADSEVSPTWLADIETVIDSGVDAVAGVVEFAPPSPGEKPFPFARRLEDRYAALQAEVIARADPDLHNPWPNHLWAWGANFALTVAAYRAIGGLPSQPLAEDRALASALRAHDFKIRHSLDVRVRTSRREQGRAPGGLADLVRNYANDDAHPCDAELEPILTALERARTRRALREAWTSASGQDALTRRLKLDPTFVASVLREPKFGSAWLRIEMVLPALSRVRLLPEHLPLEIARAEHLLAELRPSGANDPADMLRAASAGLWSAEALPA